MTSDGRTVQLALVGIVVLVAPPSWLPRGSEGWADGESRTELTSVETGAALAVLADVPTFAELTAGREWTVVDEAPELRDGRLVAFGLIIELSEPIDSDGPWKAVRCQGTVSHDFDFPYRGVSTLAAGFEPDGSRLIGLQPLPSASLTFDDADVGRQPKRPACSIGREDKEN